MARTNQEITMEVVENIAVVSQKGTNSLELRLVSWNGAEPKYDLRNWYVDRDGNEKCAKGLTLTNEEVKSLRDILNGIEFAEEEKGE